MSNIQEGESDFSEGDNGDVSELDEAVERAPYRSVLKKNQKVKASANKRKAVARPGSASGSERDELVKSFAKRKRTPARGGPLSSSLIAQITQIVEAKADRQAKLLIQFTEARLAAEEKRDNNRRDWEMRMRKNEQLWRQQEAARREVAEERRRQQEAVWREAAEERRGECAEASNRHFPALIMQCLERISKSS